jgi:acyl-CoA synthetase (AMP-forming)/AMP-acid ligase II
MISHRNVIANVLQHATFEQPARSKKGIQTQVVNGILPFSHIYGLVVVSHTGPWRGDGIIVMPKFEFDSFLRSIQKFKIEQLILVSINLSLFQFSLVIRVYKLT